MENCVFCQIIRGEIPGTFVHQDDRAVIFLDINQAAQGHLLIAPRNHREQWHELDDATAAHLGKLAADFAPAVVNAFDADGYNLLQNNGEAAGQEVMHVHLHLIPRWQNDHYFGRGPRQRKAEAEELQDTAERIETEKRKLES
ncbi:MAG: HIT family protein [Chloroflexota bacterium]|nr:HIT family protein [Chloroflexota bacterium]